MKLHATLPAVFVALLGIATLGEAARQPKDAVLLKNINSLTLRKGQKTSHRRVSALPQLKCIGGSGKGHFEVDVMRCTNSGSGYNEHDIEWTCKASLPPEFKLGSTDVLCEGYSSPDDPYVLKGSCGVEYRLILTDLGEEKYGSKGWFGSSSKSSSPMPSPDSEPASERFFNFIFWCLFVGVALWIAYVFLKSLFNNGNPPPRRTPRQPRVPRGGGGGGGGYDDGNDPPPPYDPGDWQRYSKPQSYSSSSSRSWRPGFWTGAATGAAAAAYANRGSRTQGFTNNASSSWFGGGGGRNYDAGEGSSGTRRSSSHTSTEPSSSRYESTGFGSTQRR